MLSMHAVSRYNLAAAVPLGGSATFESLAAASGLAEDATRRLIRHAMSKNIFCHATTTITTSDVAGKPTTTTVVDGDRVAHTAVSRLLAEDPALNDWLRVSTDESYRAAAHTLDALERWPGSEEPHETVSFFPSFPPSPSFSFIHFFIPALHLLAHMLIPS